MLEQIKVDIGKDGTDGDVVLEICGDHKLNDCKKTETLKHRLKDDWHKDKTEFWYSGKFGAAKDYEFEVKHKMEVIVTKTADSKNDDLTVKQIELTAKPKNKTITSSTIQVRFTCNEVSSGPVSSGPIPAGPPCSPFGLSGLTSANRSPRCDRRSRAAARGGAFVDDA